MSEFQTLQKEIHDNAIAHGWYEEPQRTFGELIALCHSELSEALEEYRSERLYVYYNCTEGDISQCNPADTYECLSYGKESECKYRAAKPEGIAIELADCVIRIMDMCEYLGIDLWEAMNLKHEYNKTRPYKHGGKVI